MEPAHYSDPLEDALSHGSQRVAQFASLIGAMAQVFMQRMALHDARKAARNDQQVTHVLDEQERLLHRQVRLSWAAAHDPQWLARADLLETGRAWAGAAAYADTDPAAASAMPRASRTALPILSGRPPRQGRGTQRRRQSGRPHPILQDIPAGRCDILGSGRNAMNVLAHSYFFWIALILGLLGLYILPSVIAAIRGVEGLGWIIVINLLLTGVGWGAALIGALMMPRRETPAPLPSQYNAPGYDNQPVAYPPGRQAWPDPWHQG
jgi:hypothetical protein